MLRAFVDQALSVLIVTLTPFAPVLALGLVAEAIR
jgi:hypothetical protein